jgi:DNA-binding SARP family transcriptional activator
MASRQATRLTCVPSILICLLGQFRVVNSGQDVSIARGSKIETLLTYLALHYGDSIAREPLLSALWPDCNSVHAGQSLNSLVYSVQRLFENVQAGVSPVVQANGYYRLNEQAGICVDIALFSAQAEIGDKSVREGTVAGAAEAYERAVAYYRGDLCANGDVNALLEREYLRARYLGTLAWLADYHFALYNYQGTLQYVRRLLASDACREDAHRLAMRCYVRIGQRAQALRQYQLCRTILLDEFDAEPEPTTTALYQQVRLDPGAI